VRFGSQPVSFVDVDQGGSPLPGSAAWRLGRLDPAEVPDRQFDRHRGDFRRLLWTALHSESHPEVRGSRTGWREGRLTRAAVKLCCT
jgi:hypothetical protein